LALVFVRSGASAQDPATRERAPTAEEQELQVLLDEERRAADLARRRGSVQAAVRTLKELLDENADDFASRTLLARCLLDRADYAAARDAARRALDDARRLSAPSEARAACARNLAEIELVLGRASDALAVLTGEPLTPERDARDAWVLARAFSAAGQRAQAAKHLALGAAAGSDQDWEGLAARAACQRAQGDLSAASRTLVRADEVAKQSESTGRSAEPDVLALLADVYFEADREVKDAEKRSAAALYNEALALDPTHEPSLLGLFALYRYNWQRRSKSAQGFLDEAFRARPNSIAAHVAGTAADIDDGQLKSARERLKLLGELAPARRDVRTLRATLSFVEHDVAASDAVLAELAAEDPSDSAPERELGRHLLELYRFAEGLPFVRRATLRNEHDAEAWTQLGRALANTGDEKGARDALDRAQAEAGGRQDAWRNNLRVVLKKMSAEHVQRTDGDLSFSWNPEHAAVLTAYMVPFYSDARAELATRYGFTPGPTRIEVFKDHRDFSVRSTGFEGFPALGVCFGPVVTAVSPMSELRGTFAWTRTSFHEFTHVIHLGLSHNRCPRWITEGLATWEEVNRNPSWTRNMRRELLDAVANGDVIPVRDLNRAFRGQRILFGYYQGGLLCQMLIERHGFPPMIRLLEAFDRGLDLDQAFQEVFRATPEDVDREFDAFVAREIGGLRIEPRWSSARVARLKLGLANRPPPESAVAERRMWADGWCTVAQSAWQRRRKVDAQEALRVLSAIQPEPPRAMILRGEMLLSDGDTEGASRAWKAALAAGADDFRARIALGSLAAQADDFEEAEAEFLAAERAFPGFDERELSAELKLVKLYEENDREDDAMRARERWLAYEAGDLVQRRKVAAWHFEHKRFEESARRYQEAIEIDLFLRQVHRALGDSLFALGKHEGALREFEMVIAVPPEFDLDSSEPLGDEDQAEILARQAACHAALSRNDAALECVKKALALDPDCDAARELLLKLQ
jgi:tetratricopeptide (TPR) repeat protein